MKRLPALVVIASLVFVGCTTFGTEEPREESLLPMAFSASVSEEPDVKAAIDGLDIKWSEGDKIGIYDGTAFREFSIKEGIGTTSAVFEGEAASAESYIAVYPYNENLAVDSYGRITGLSVPRIQTAGTCPVIMTAECKDGGNAFAFKSALAYVKVTPQFDCNKIVLETYDSEDYRCWSDLCGDVELNLEEKSARVVGNNDNHVILGGDIKAGCPYYFGVAPKYMYKGFMVIFDALDNNLQYIRKTEKDAVVQRGHVMNLGQFSKDSYWTERDADLAFSENDIWGSEHFDYRSVYDWKDVTRIASHCRKIGSSKTVFVYFMGDIDFGGRELKPGIFDVPGGMVSLVGNDHEISNYIQGSADCDGVRHAGMFFVRNCADFTISNLRLRPKRFELSCGGDICGGAFVSKGYCTDRLSFHYCKVYGDISVKCTGNAQTYAGGYVGMAEVQGSSDGISASPGLFMEYCQMDGSVTAYSQEDIAYAGGFFGYINAPKGDFQGSLTRSRNRAVILAEGDDDSATGFFSMDGISAGGIVGCDRDNGGNVVLEVNSCVNEGSVSAHAKDNDNAFAGGMIGCHDSDGSHPDGGEMLPYVSNCFNMGTITAISTDSDDNAAGMVGYCYNDNTSFSNCVDSGILSGNVCAHISGTKGSYSGICYWTTADSLPGIHDKYDHGQYGPERMSGYKTDLAVTDLHPAEGEAGWIMRDGHLDLDIIR